MLRRFFYKIFKIFLLGGLIAANAFNITEAKPLPEISWAHDIYMMTVSDDYENAEKKRSYQLLNAGTPEQQQLNREKIIQAIADKLKEQEAVLPFKLLTTFDTSNLSEQNFELNDSAGNQNFALVPIVVTDFAIEQEYVLNGQSRYKYIIISALDIAFCTEDEDGAFTILSNIPLHFYETIPLSNKIEQMDKKERAELAAIYTNFTVNMIKKHLDFSKSKKVIKRLEDKQYNDTYRVEDVTYTSDKARSVLGMNRLMQRIAGNIFTSDYAAHTGNVVYPMILNGDNSTWIMDATKGMYVNHMNTSHSGEKVVQMPSEVNHKIYLDVSGAGSKEVETKYTSNINGFKAYRLWMKSTLDGKSIEITNDITEEYLKDNSATSKIIKEEREIFGGLMIGAAVKSAAAQAGKKVK